MVLNLIAGLMVFGCKKTSPTSSPAADGPATNQIQDNGGSGESSTGGTPGSILIPDQTTNASTTGSSTGVFSQIASLTADDAESNFPPGQLNLEPIELVPIDLTGALALSSTEMDEAEVRFSWNPAQEPLERANSLLCAFQMLRSGSLANQGPYIAKGQFAKNCFTSAKNMGTAAGANSNKSSEKIPQEAVVVSSKQPSKPMDVEAYITMPYNILSTMGATTDGGSSESTEIKEEANVYLSAKIAEPPSTENPFGLFRLTYQAFKSVNGTEEGDPFWQGYINVTKNLADGAATKDIKLDFHQVYSEISGTQGYRYKNGQVHKATALMTIADANSSHGKPVDKSFAKTATEYFWEQVDGDGTGNNQGFQDQSGSYALVYSADAQRSLTKWTRAPGTSAWWSSDSETDVGSSGGTGLTEGDACTAATDPVGKCAEDNNFYHCNGIAVSRSTCIYEGGPCTDADVNDMCDQDSTFRHCEGIARTGATCPFDPEAPTCRSTNEYAANVYQYGLFDSAGNRIYHATGYPVQTGKIDAWGWPITGWLGNGGLWLSGVRHGDAVSIHDPNWASPKNLVFHDIPGTLRTDNWQLAKAQNDFYLTCTSNSCPTGAVGENGVIKDVAITTANQKLIVAVDLVGNSVNFTEYEVNINPGMYSYAELASELNSKLQAATGNRFSADYLANNGKYSITYSEYALQECASFYNQRSKILWHDARTTAEEVLGYDATVDEGGCVYNADHPRAPVVINLTSQNNKLVYYLTPSLGSELGPFTASLTPGEYTPDSLALALRSQLESVCSGCGNPGPNFTVAFNASNRFILGFSGAEAFRLAWTHPDSTMAAALGFETATDDSGQSQYEADQPIGLTYRYDVSELALYRGSERIRFADGVRNSSLYLSFQVIDNGGNNNINVGDVYRYDMYQSAWQGMNLGKADGSWLNLYDYATWDAGSGKYSPIELTCSTCPKDIISRNDVSTRVCPCLLVG